MSRQPRPRRGSPRSRRGYHTRPAASSLVVTVVVGLAASLLAGATPFGPVAGASGPATPGWFDDAVATVTDATVTTLAAAQLEQVAADRARAVLRGARDPFLAGVAAPARADQARQLAWLSAVPLSGYSLALAGTPGAAAVRAGRVTTGLTLRYRLLGDPVDTRRHVRATFVRQAHGWVVSAWRPATPDVWDLGPVTTARRGRVLVVGSEAAAGSGGLPSIAADGASALAAVRRVWPYPWSRRTTVVLPADEAQTASVLAVDRSDLTGLGAVTTGETPRATPAAAGSGAGERGRAVTLRVTLNPRYYAGLSPVARQILLRHEITHVAQYGLDPDRLSSVPTWFSEGLAEYVGYRNSAVPFAVVAQSLLDRVRAGRAPDFPSDRAFGFGRSAAVRSLAYRAGWAACVYVAERYGERRLFGLYRAVAEGRGRPQARVARTVSQRLGVSLPQLTREWQAWLRARA